MSAPDLLVRPATHADDASVRALIRSLDPTDYLLEAWSRWVDRPSAVTIVAELRESRGTIVGCVYGEPTVADDAWMQGARVDRRLQRLGVASELMRSVQSELCRRGSRAVFGTISAFNEASLAMVAGLGWREVARISRRRGRGRSPESVDALTEPPICDAHRVSTLLRAGSAFASRRELSYFRRRYFTMSPAYVARMASLGAIRVSPGERAAAILDLEAPESAKSLWVTALAGEPSGLRSLLDRLGAEATRAGKDVLIDVPETPGIEVMLDERGFDAVDRDERFVVVQKLLETSR